jgi:hypothetical protein
VAETQQIKYEITQDQMDELQLYCEAISSLSAAKEPQARLASLYHRMWLKLREIRGDDKE